MPPLPPYSLCTAGIMRSNEEIVVFLDELYID